MFRSIIFALTLALVLVAASAAEGPFIDPARAEQLRRLEPLTNSKIDVFVESGQLTPVQAAYIKRHLTDDGKLALPADAIAPAPAPPRRPVEARAGERDPYADFKYALNATDRERLNDAIRGYRDGNRPAIGRELRAFRPAVNQLIAAAYNDPIDLPVKIALWEEVAGPANPDAAIGLYDTHRAAYELARPVLIPYAKDVGGIHVRRRRGGDGAYPAQRFFYSRDLREMILDVEGLIAHCSSVSAATFLMDLYGVRYAEGEAPMRDKGRDRHRLVEACGGDPKHFDEDEPHTWDSRLSASDRAAIADRLIPWLHRSNSDRRKIARNGLMICLPRHHPDWDAGREKWERWFEANRDGFTAAP